MQDFFILQQFVAEMAATSSTNSKKEILEKYKDNEFIRKVLVYTYHPFKQYYVTPKNLKKKAELSTEGYDNIFVLLDDLNDRKITGHDAIGSVNGFISKFKPFEDLIHQIFDRNLKTRATATIINEIIPGLIPTFSVQLCEKYEKVADKDKINQEKYMNGKKKSFDPVINFERDDWFGSFKLDGYRCIAIIDENSDTQFFSRNGNQFHTLGKIAKEIKELGIKNIIFDGELCINTEDGRDDFQAIQKEAIQKDHTIERPKYWLFDMIPTDVFYAEYGGELFSERLNKLTRLLAHTHAKTIQILPQVKIKSEEDLYRLRDMAIEAGREGLIVKKDTVYQGKRTNDLLKAKVMHDAEYLVKDAEFDVNRVIVDGVEKEEVMLARVVIEHKGNRVAVGSGFNLEEKRHYFKYPNEIIGATITVKYQEETIDQHGKYSLRFPIVKVIHGRERTL